jgi:hypothetical protein
MIRSRNPRIDAAALEARVHARTIESELQTAEARSIPRASWPPDLRVPLISGSARLQRLVMRVMALAFRDQHEANAALIRSQREMLALVQTLTERVETLEAQLEAERAAARAQRIARRQSDDR